MGKSKSAPPREFFKEGLHTCMKPSTKKGPSLPKAKQKDPVTGERLPVFNAKPGQLVLLDSDEDVAALSASMSKLGDNAPSQD